MSNNYKEVAEQLAHVNAIGVYGSDCPGLGQVKGLAKDYIKLLDERMTPEQARERIEKLESTFRHIHVNSGDGTDACKECGLDLRDEIHIRA